MTTRPVYAAFAISGVAGLIYEALWSRYLGLYVGHGAYAQVLVLSVYLGGMAVGSLAVSGLSRRLAQPLRWYALAELVLALFGFFFHLLFEAAVGLSYDVLFPAVGQASYVGALRWAIAGALILPQAAVLGTTFPLMAAGLVRSDRDRPGHGVALVYLLNTVGAAAGVLIAGFWMIGTLGLPGTSVAAAVLNLLAAGLVWRATRTPAEVAVEEDTRGVAGPPTVTPRVTRRPAAVPADDTPAPDQDAPWVGRPRLLAATLLTVSCGTALASFAYEIGWIRMLSLVLGSATHAFELMLSAFIFGLAVGAWLVRNAADRTRDPVHLLGVVQLLMGLTALISIPLYVGTFDIMAALMQTLPDRAGGYALFNLSRYGICLAVMLPSTTLAGMTLPVITAALLRAGLGEKSIGEVYALNTIGSVAGAAIAGLVALPYLGLKGLIMAGAALDVGLGLVLLARSARLTTRSFAALAAGAAACVIGFSAVGSLTELSPTLLSSGVYRSGDLPGEERHLSLYFEDGRTATVSAHIGRADGVIVLATNGKPDASIGPRWVMERRDTMPIQPIPQGRDFTTQVIAPMIALAHHPRARTVANIGHGSGMSATSFLTSSYIERLVTIEIEPLMVEGSLVFMPANAPAFADPRSTYVFDDAKSYFSYQQERFEVIFAEPSNPWVSGTASLFTREFYERVTDFMAEGGVLAQWMQIYELNDELFLSVLAALDAVFPYYRAYQVGDADVAIVARFDGPVGEPDWSVVANERFEHLTASAPEFTPSSLDALFMFDQNTFRALLDAGVPANSDYDPILDTGAERARFLGSFADGVYSFSGSRVDLARTLSGKTHPPAAYSIPPAYGLTSAVLSARGAWLRETLAAGGGIAPEEFPEWMEELRHLESFLLDSRRPEGPRSWEVWSNAFTRAEAALHWGTTGWADSTFYGEVYRLLDRVDAPADARATVDLSHGFSLRDWERVAGAADRLVLRVAAGQRWTLPEQLLDMAVLAYVEVDRPQAARNGYELLRPRVRGGPDHLRYRLLDALIARAEAGAGAGS